MRDDFRAAALFHKRPLDQIGRTDVLLMAFGHFKMVETRVRIIQDTATEFGELALVALDHSLAALLGFLPTGRIAHIHEQRLHLRPRLSGHLLLEVLHLVKPAANPQ